jgi:hypothetical protein
MIKTPPCGLTPSGDRPNFVLFVSFVVKTFFRIWSRLCGLPSSHPVIRDCGSLRISISRISAR